MPRATNPNLAFARNMLGQPLKPISKQRIEAFLRCPCYPHWNECYSIVLNGASMMTLWQAVIAIDPTFPRSGPVTDQHGKVLADWAKIPTADQVKEAIYYATH